MTIQISRTLARIDIIVQQLGFRSGKFSTYHIRPHTIQDRSYPFMWVMIKTVSSPIVDTTLPTIIIIIIIILCDAQ